MNCLRKHLFPFALLAALAGCNMTPPDRLTVVPTRYEALDGWVTDHHVDALQAFQRNCEAIVQQSGIKPVGKGLLAGTSYEWQVPCREAMRLQGEDVSHAQARDFFERFFTPFRAGNNEKEIGLFTGYFEPDLFGSLKKTPRYRYPLYRLPPDVKQGKAYFSREEIENGALKGRGLELLWVDDPVDAFFLQIQGSGRINLPDGKVVRVGYAGKNNHAYIALGKVMGDLDLLPKDQINFFTIRRWLKENPDQAAALMNENPSYVFFRMIDKDGAVGGSGAVLTPLRSLAVDTRFVPYPTPIFLQTTLPATDLSQEEPFQRLMIAQDTGGAIKGPVRGDVFFGAGVQAEAWAGMMKQRGTYVLLVPHPIAARVLEDL